MSATARAAVLRGIGDPLVLEEITLAPLAPDQVRVRIAASGVCHSDLSQATGVLPAGTPCVLGHEGAGVVEEVGAQIQHVAPGDHVVMAWVAACGRCWYCQRGEVHLCRNAIRDVYSMPYASDDDGTALFTSMAALESWLAAARAGSQVAARFSTFALRDAIFTIATTPRMPISASIDMNDARSF